MIDAALLYAYKGLQLSVWLSLGVVVVAVVAVVWLIPSSSSSGSSINCTRQYG